MAARTAAPWGHARLITCVAAALSPGAAALRGRLVEPSAPRIAQMLHNSADTQYSGDISIGGQDITGILDTGSFELVVFSKTCTTCGIASKYDETVSHTFRRGNLTQWHVYGSDECAAADGYDQVTMAGGLRATDQAIWISQECDMATLEQAGFNAIVGIGPPGEPVETAQERLEVLESQATEVSQINGGVPEDMAESVAEAKQELEIARSKRSLLENLGVTTFSHCLGRLPGSPGMLVWNDDEGKSGSGVVQLRVLQDVFWGVSMTSMALKPRASKNSEVVACQGGCYAVVDTGTSLFAVPSDVYNEIFASLDNWLQNELPEGTPEDCSDLSAFPHLELTVDGEKLSFPPSSYIGSYVGTASKQVLGFIHQSRLKRSVCQLLIMDMGAADETDAGPMLVLGMPFFREYYTTFDLGSSSRSLFVSKAGDRCEQPPSGNTMVADRVRGQYAEHEYAYRPRKVDVSKLSVPKLLRRGRSARKAD